MLCAAVTKETGMLLPLVMFAGVLIMGTLAAAYGWTKLNAQNETNARVENRLDQACTLADLDHMVEERVEARVKDAFELERRRIAEKQEQLNGLIADVQTLIDTLSREKNKTPPLPRVSTLRSHAFEVPSFADIQQEEETTTASPRAPVNKTDEPEAKRVRKNDSLD